MCPCYLVVLDGLRQGLNIAEGKVYLACCAGFNIGAYLCVLMTLRGDESIPNIVSYLKSLRFIISPEQARTYYKLYLVIVKHNAFKYLYICPFIKTQLYSMFRFDVLPKCFDWLKLNHPHAYNLLCSEHSESELLRQEREEKEGDNEDEENDLYRQAREEKERN